MIRCIRIGNCETNIDNHFRKITKMVTMGGEVKRFGKKQFVR